MREGCDGWNFLIDHIRETFLFPGPPVKWSRGSGNHNWDNPDRTGQTAKEWKWWESQEWEGVSSEVTVYALSEYKMLLAESKNLAHHAFSQTSPSIQKAPNSLLTDRSCNKGCRVFVSVSWLQDPRAAQDIPERALPWLRVRVLLGTHSRSTWADENAGVLTWGSHLVCSEN